MDIIGPIFINFKDYGLDEYLPIDPLFMAYQLEIAEMWLDQKSTQEEKNHFDVETVAAMIKLRVDFLQYGLTADWLGRSLLTMALRGLLGHPTPDYFKWDDEG